MSKKNLDFIKHFYFTVLIFAIVGLFLPWQASAQKKGDRSSLPTIISFDIKHITVDEGGSKKSNWIEFSWKTEGASIVKLYKDGREIKGRNQLSDGTFGWPLSLKGGFKSQFRRSAVYEIVAENNVGKASKTLDTKMTKKEAPPFYIKPEIVNFRVVPQKIKPGDKVRFYWQVKNAQQVQLFDRSGVIESRIQMANGEYGWPRLMNGAYMENLGKSETYVLVATNKSGNVKKKVTVSVSGRECSLIMASISGIYSKYTSAVGVFKVVPGAANKFLFKRPVSSVNHQGKSSQRSTIKLPSEGEYLIVPSGGGKDKYGNFGVLYKPRSIRCTCTDGNVKFINFNAHTAEY